MSGLFQSYAASGQYLFNISNAEVLSQAFERIGIRRTALEPNHIQNGVTEFNLFLAAFNTAGPNLAQVDLQTQALTQGTATYSLTAETVMLLDVFLSYPGGSGTQDAYMYGISRTEYAAIPDKTLQGKPNQYWYNRQQTPTITLFPVPDGNGPYTLNWYRFRQVQDSLLANGQSPEVPNRAVDAIVAGLAYRLSRIYRQDLEAARKADAGEAWSLYARQDTENVPLYIQPALSTYYRV